MTSSYLAPAVFGAWVLFVAWVSVRRAGGHDPLNRAPRWAIPVVILALVLGVFLLQRHLR